MGLQLMRIIMSRALKEPKVALVLRAACPGFRAEGQLSVRSLILEGVEQATSTQASLSMQVEAWAV